MSRGDKNTVFSIFKWDPYRADCFKMKNVNSSIGRADASRIMRHRKIVIIGAKGGEVREVSLGRADATPSWWRSFSLVLPPSYLGYSLSKNRELLQKL